MKASSIALTALAEYTGEWLCSFKLLSSKLVSNQFRKLIRFV